ncbi:TniQ family protein [Actinomadura sp. BRA 177]|uniref:TniQ family protein n=1 Tax=Actinomadura sp. BRA 177 TaxID=2745202 RepID=UPI0015958DD7|nr:TniQ family protein [Actinomadura sp. BRA 177]NVI86329.1 TniQ family protein [Actinomadura sp. BRA 177]
MRRLGVRRLAYVPAPLEKESLLSWLDQVAAEFGVSRPRAAEMVGLWGRDRSTLHVLGLRLPARVLERVTATTGLTATRLELMTLWRYRRSAFMLKTSGRREVFTASGEWVHAQTSLVCPECLASNGGRWLLPWKLGFSYACVEHGCYLLAGCGCPRGRTARAPWPRFHSTRSVGQCAVSCPDCGRWLGEMEAPRACSDEVLRVQRIIDHLLDAPGDEEELKQIFRDLRWLAAMALSRADDAVELLDGTDPQIIDQLSRHANLPRKERGLLAADNDILLRAAGLVVAARVVFADSLLVGGAWFVEGVGAWDELVFPFGREGTGVGRWVSDLVLLAGKVGGRNDLFKLAGRYRVPPSRRLRPPAEPGSEAI